MNAVTLPGGGNLDPVRRIAVVNALPSALKHYQARLLAMLGPVASSCNGPGIEKAAGGSRPARLMGHRRQLREAARTGGAILDLWPAAGALEPLLLPRRTPAAVVIHDPTSLERPDSSEASAALASKVARWAKTRVVVHSEAARAALAPADPTLVAIPIAEPDGFSRRLPDRPVVRVLGQYKQARDVALLESLGPRLAAAGITAEIVGRGWPEVAGWSVSSRFVSEQEFDDLIDTSNTLLVPYQRFWQSGVAARALERCCPSVGPQASFIGELQAGADWLVASDDSPAGWLAAIDAAIAAPQPKVHDIAATYWQRGMADFAQLAADLSAIGR